ncbi:MAG: aldehyde dehydrogenase [Cyclobacteriaceae bacterium]|nr:MAG: aldehyde dehydrogenase [Cyclobacteriaceae bacterium]
MKVINPATERVIKNIPADDQDTIQEKYQLARQAQASFKKTRLTERLQILERFNDLLEKNLDRLAELLTSEVGKPIVQSRNEINGARSRISFFLKNSEAQLSGQVVYQDGNLTERTVYEPLGVIANISAWNYPYLVGVNVFVPALVAGNAVLYKPSEYSSLTGLELQKLWLQAGLEPGVFQAVIGRGQVGRLLVELPLDGYFFTGSYATGKQIYQTVAKKMVTCQLELGGKDPLYVTAKNNNIHAVAVAAVEGAFYNNGQSCCAVERIYVHQQVYYDFINDFVKEVKLLKMGDPASEGVTIGPLTRKQQVSFLEDQVEDALSKGAKVLSGGKAETRQGYFFQPTVVINTNHEMKIMKQESFGPVIGIQMVESDQQAVELMQDTDYGLTASVYSDDQQQALDILSSMDTGTVYWNCCDRVSPRLPWSGRRHSGFGSTLSEAGIRVFTRPKAYHLRAKS